jgi:hypothetical protein
VLNSHQPDRTRTPASQAGAACVPSGQLLAAAPDLMTVEHSLYLFAIYDGIRDSPIAD